MNRSHRAVCQVAGCHSLAARAVEVDLPAAWEATPGFTTLPVHAVCCEDHGHEVERRVQAMLEARSDLYNLIAIIEAAVRFEKALELRLDAATGRGDQLDRENGGLRQQLQDTEAALRLARRRGRELIPAGGAA